MEKLSIIVPAFNVEMYLPKCLDSILRQDIPACEYEVIVVIDGATDNSLMIANEYARRNKNIKVINQDNKGLGAARNVGIKACNGKYVLFVDSDDYLNNSSLNEILVFIEQKRLDLLRFNYEAENESGFVVSKRRNSLHSIVFSETVCQGQYFLSNQLGWACYAWQFIIKRDFIVKNQLFFNETIYFEDVEWLVRVLIKAQRVCSIDKPIYIYRQREGSITRSIDIKKQEKVYKDKLFLLNFLKKQAILADSKSIKRWCKGMQGLLIISLFPFIKTYLPEKKKEFYKCLKENKYTPIIPFRYTFKQWQNVLLINIMPSLYYRLKG